MARPGEMHTDMSRGKLNRQTHQRKDGPLSLAFFFHLFFFQFTHLLRKKRITATAPAVKGTYRRHEAWHSTEKKAVTLSKTICAAAEVEEALGSLTRAQ